MAAEAAHAYDSVLYVGKDPSKTPAKKSSPAPAAKTPAKKVTAKKAVAASAPAKKVTAKKVPAAADETTKADISLEQILAAAPALRLGQMQPLGDIVKQLHSARLIGKNTTSTKLFKKFPERFELTPDKQPNQVRYLPV
jgi:3-oxoacyl-ACP reductase-like protein